MGVVVVCAWDSTQRHRGEIRCVAAVNPAIPGSQPVAVTIH